MAIYRVQPHRCHPHPGVESIQLGFDRDGACVLVETSSLDYANPCSSSATRANNSPRRESGNRPSLSHDARSDFARALPDTA